MVKIGDEFKVVAFDECNACRKNKFPIERKYKTDKFGIVKICLDCVDETGWIEWFHLNENNLEEIV